MPGNDAITRILNIQGVFVNEVDTRGLDEVHVYLERVHRGYGCARCGQWHLVPYDEHWVCIQDLPMSGKRVYLHFRKGRVLCCRGQPETEQLSWVGKNGRQTHRLRWALYKECHHSTVKVVAQRHGLCWQTVKNIDKAILEARMASRSLRDVRRVSIDEISRARHQKYLTVVTDLDSRKVVWVGKGRKSSNIKKFCKAIPFPYRHLVRVVAMDMWRPYQKGVAQEFPDAEIVFSKFHVIGHLQKALDAVRRAEAKRLEDDEQKQIVGGRWVLLKNPEKLKPKQQTQLRKLLKENETLHKAYLLKEDFRLFYQLDFEWHRRRRLHDRILELAGNRLEGWIARARDSALKAFQKFCDLLERHRDGILRYFIHRVSTGLSEAMNSKINALKARARGYRDFDYFIYKIYQQCGTIA